MRRFEKGMALVNPKGNGTRTVQVGLGYKHISGTQDPNVNNGQPVETVTSSERDGLILIGTDAVDEGKRPKAPVLIVVDP